MKFKLQIYFKSGFFLKSTFLCFQSCICSSYQMHNKMSGFSIALYISQHHAAHSLEKHSITLYFIFNFLVFLSEDFHCCSLGELIIPCNLSKVCVYVSAHVFKCVYYAFDRQQNINRMEGEVWANGLLHFSLYIAPGFILGQALTS